MNLVAAVADNDQKISAKNSRENQKTSMSAQNPYITSILAVFESFLKLPQAAGTSRAQEQATLLLLAYLAHKQDYSRWNLAELEDFLEKSPRAAGFDSHPKQLVTQFVREYPPYQTSVLLHAYALALRAENCSYSTLKNYRSDINQFFTFAGETELERALTKPKVAGFLRSQRQKGLKKSSVRRKLASLTQFAGWLERQGLITGVSAWLAEYGEQLEEAVDWEGLPVVSGRDEETVDSDTRQWTMPLKAEAKGGAVGTPLAHAAGVGLITAAAAKPAPQATPVGTARAQQEFRTRLKQQLNAISGRVEGLSRAKIGSQPLLAYINLAVALLFVAGMGVFGYMQFIRDTDSPLAYPSALTPPNRTLSFQGRLTDENRNPVPDPTDMRFKLYDDGPAVTGGSLLWDSGTCTIDPDQDGIFSTGLGDECGGAITEDVFTENTNVWLQVEIDNGSEYEVLEPRQAIKTVPYAINSETLQGFPPANPATENTVLVMDEYGDINLGSLNPDLKATSGTFTIEAQSMVLQTTSGSNGDIVLAPDGSGEVAALSDVFISGYLRAPGATFSATYAGGTPLVVNGVSGQSANLSVWNDGNGNVTVVDEDGRIGIGTSNPSHGLDVSGTGRFTGQLTADGALKLNSTLLDENNQAGTAGQILSSTGTGVDWIDATTFTDTDDQTLAEVLTEGNTTSGNNIVMSTTDEIRFYDDDNDSRIYSSADGTINLASTNIAIDTSTWDVTTAGAFSGITTLSMSGQLTSSLATGTAPFSIASTTVVTNLNADMLDGYHYNELPYLPTGTDDWVDETGDTITGTLNFSGVDSDITTDTNEHLALMPGGTGNVGIGTTAPAYKLDISGTLRASGTVNFSGLAAGGLTTSVLALDGSNNVDLIDISGYDSDNSDDLTTSTNFGGDVSGVYNNLQIGSGVVGTTEIANGSIQAEDLETTNSATDNYLLSYDAGTGGFTWVQDSTGDDDQTLAEVLAEGNTTSAHNIVMSTTDEIRFYDDDNDSRIYSSADGTINLASTNIAIDTSTWDVTTAGAFSGITTLSMSGQLTSTVASGTAPFVVASNTLVTNLNADLLDGYHYDELPYVPAGTDDWVDEAGDTMTGTLNFSGVTNDITTAGNEHLALMPGGTGNVGIGTSSPGYKLDVSGDINLSTALRAGGDAGTAGYLLTSSGGGAMTWTDPASLAAGTIAFNNITSGTNTVAAMVVGSGASLTYSGSGTINASTLAGQAISALPYVNDATNATLTRTGSGPYTLELNLANANTWTGAQTFSANTNFPGSGIWNTSGDVGIGTTSPSGKLHIAGLSELDGSAPITFIINDTRNSNGWTVGAPFGQINFNSNDSSGGGVGTRARVAAVMENDQGGITGLAFSTAGTGGLVERMRINNLGNVGIGTTNPVSKLQVGNPSVHETHDVNFYGGYNLYFDDGWDARFFWHGAKGALRVGSKGDGSGWDPANIGDYSIALGTGGTASGDKSIAIGSVVNASGDRSIALGGFVTVSGTRSVGIGLDTTPRTISQDNTMAILGGSVGIGTTSPTYLLDVSGGSGIVGRFSGRVIGANAVNNDEFVTKLQLDNATASSLPAGTSGQTLRHNGTAWIANSFLYNSGTNIGIGTSSPAAMLDVVGWSDNLSALFGNNTTNNFNKQTYIGSRHYTNAEEPINIIGVVSGSSTSNLRIGGGTSNLNAATEIRLYTAANTTTTTGTARMTIYSNGNIGIGFTTAPAARLDVVGESNDITALFGNVTSLNSSKFANIGLRHYAGSTEEPLGLIAATSSNSINNVFIGGGASVLNAATQIQFYTAANTTTTTGTARMTINSSGNVGIGTASPAVRFHVNGNARIVFAAAAANTVCRDANGTFTICSSLAQYKDNKQNLSLGLETIMQLRPVEFDWNINDKSHDLGLIAEEVAAVNPLLAQYESDGSLSGVKYHHMVALLVKGIQQQQGQITSLSSQLAALNPSAITADQLNNFFIDSTGNLVIETTDSGAYQVRDTADNSLATVIGKMAELVVGRLRAGAISVRELDADSITVAGLPLSDYVASVVAQLGSSPAPTNPSELISPVAHLENLEVTGETLLANLLVAEDATFSGTLAAQDLTAETTLLGELTANTATIAGTLVAENIEAGNISAATISAYSTRLALLESRTAEFEHMKAQTAELLEATVSGTLYADNIHGFDSKIASAFNEPTITDILKDKVFNSINTTQNSLEMVYDTIALAGYEASSSADLNLTLADVASQEGGLNLGGATAFIDKYFKVNGIAYVADTLGVGNKLMIGQGTTIADGIIEYTALAGTEQTLAIQPSGRGSLTLMAGLMTLTENGNVIIDGNLAVAGNLAVQDTLLANLVQPADFGNPFQVQVAGISDDGGSVKESRFEIINETGTPVATISAEGRADFAAGIGVGSEELDGSDDAEANTNKTSGRATILAGQSELTIRSKRIGSNSLVYVTPVGSTQNQVLYVKSQRPDDPDTPDNEGKFVVGFDQPVTEDVQFNWWIVN